jgi:hypothetical protein
MTSVYGIKAMRAFAAEKRSAYRFVPGEQGYNRNRGGPKENGGNPIHEPVSPNAFALLRAGPQNEFPAEFLPVAAMTL